MLLRLVIVLFAAAALPAMGGASAQDFPSRPIRILNTAPGAFADISARLFAPGLSARLGQPVLVDNRATAIIAIDTAAKAAADGYTLLLYGNGVWLARFLSSNMPYDPMDELTPITLSTRVPNLLVVHPSLPVKSVADLIALARAKPSEINYAHLAGGGMPQLAAELFKSMTGVKVVGVAYRGGAGVNAVIAGEMQFMFASGATYPQVKAGRLRGIATTSAEPTPLLPGLPTIAASGLPGFEAVSMMAVFAPIKTPAPVIRRLNQELVAVLSDPVIKQRFFDVSADTVPSTPAQALEGARAEQNRWGKIIKEAGIRE